MVDYILARSKWYSRPHDMQLAWAHNIEEASDLSTTEVPIVMYDEGLGNPASYNAHREHSSFAEYNGPNCYPDSKIFSISAKLRFYLSKTALETDKLKAVRVAYMVKSLAFEGDYTAKDELTALETEDILEVQHETTDRQGYPLWNGTKVTEKWAGSATLGTDVPGLTTNQKMEYLAFVEDDYYDCLQYGTNSGKLRNVQHGLKWLTLTRNRSSIDVFINIKSSVKALNPYTYLGVMVHVPQTDTFNQIPPASETTSQSHVFCDFFARYDEWNPGFDMDRQ